MPIFFHDICMFKDQAGWGVYLQEHGYEHVQFVQIGQGATPTRLIPDYDLKSWQDTTEFARNWLTTHETVHEQLRGWLGTTGVNLADVDLGKEAEFYQWLDVHRSEHTAIRNALGIT